MKDEVLIMENMTSLELKAKAKELGVKSWWTLKKAQLIEEITKLEATEEVTPVEEAATTEENVQNAPESAEEVVNEESIADESTEAPAKTSRKKVDLIEYNGKSQSLSAWARELNLPGQTLYARLRISNWTVEKAFTTPAKSKKKAEEEA